MSVQTVDVGLDDKELFQGAVADEPKVEAPEAKAEPEGQPRDEHGRFAPKQEAAEEPKAEPAPEPAKVEVKDTDAHVPSWRLREVSEARQAAEARAQQAERERYQFQAQLEQMRQQIAEANRPKQEPVDFFQDPNAALQQRLSPVEERLQRMESQFRLSTSRALAVAEYGKPAVDEMNAAIEQAIAVNHPEMQGLAAQMRSSDHPVAVAMQWFQRDKLAKETGGDLTKYREKLMTDALKDPTFLARAIEAAKASAGQNARPNVNIPPSLNKAAGSGGNVAGETDAEAMSDRSLFRDAVNRR